MATVKITDQAKADAQRMMGLARNQMPDLIRQMTQTGEQMAQQENWAGPLADQYRGQIWPDARQKLQNMQNSLEELQRSVDKIMDNIARAGGA